MNEKKQIVVRYKNNKGWKEIKLSVKNEKLVEQRMKKLAEKHQDKPDITISFFIYNDISGTWMEMSAYYVPEKRFVKFT